MNYPPRRTYRVKDVQAAPRTSHRSFLFPECLYTLLRLDDQLLIRVLLPKSRQWKVGDLIEVDDRTIGMAHA